MTDIQMLILAISIATILSVGYWILIVYKALDGIMDNIDSLNRIVTSIVDVIVTTEDLKDSQIDINELLNKRVECHTVRINALQQMIDYNNITLKKHLLESENTNEKQD